MSKGNLFTALRAAFPADLATRFTGKGAWRKRLPQIVDTLEALGRVRRQGDVLTAAD